MKLLLNLSDTHGISGNEELVREIISNELEEYVDDIKIGKLGSLIAVKKGKNPRVMLAAHLDEVGLMVKEIEKNGNLKCSEVGSVDTSSLVGQKVYIKKRKGMVCGKIVKDRKLRKPEIDNLVIKTKLSKKEIMRKGVEVGDYICFEGKSRLVDGNIEGRALDDRIGCYILVELAKLLRKSDNEIYYIFTTQEEMGLYGAKTSIFHVEPDWAIIVDVSDSNDLSKAGGLGKGPIITIKDEDFIANKCINGWLKQISKSKKIPVQCVVSDEGTTDATYISLSKGGIPSTVVGVGVKGLHKPKGIANIDDINSVIKLLYELIKKPPKVCLV